MDTKRFRTIIEEMLNWISFSFLRLPPNNVWCIYCKRTIRQSLYRPRHRPTQPIQRPIWSGSGRPIRCTPQNGRVCLYRLGYRWDPSSELHLLIRCTKELPARMTTQNPPDGLQLCVTINFETFLSKSFHTDRGAFCSPVRIRNWMCCFSSALGNMYSVYSTARRKWHVNYLAPTIGTMVPLTYLTCHNTRTWPLNRCQRRRRRSAWVIALESQN